MKKTAMLILAIVHAAPAAAQVQFNRTLFDWRNQSPFIVHGGYNAFTAAGISQRDIPGRLLRSVVWGGMHDSVVSAFGMSATYFVFPFCIHDGNEAARRRCLANPRDFRNAVIISQQTPNFSYLSYYQTQLAPSEYCTFAPWEGWTCGDPKASRNTVDPGFARWLVFSS